MIKLLIMNDLVHDGGVEKVMEEIANYLPKERYNITIATIKKDYENFKKFYPSHIKYFSMEKAFKYSKNRKNIFIEKLNSLKRKLYKMLYRIKININNYDVVIAIKEGECMQFISEVKAKKKFAWVHVDYKYLHWTKYIFATNENELNCMKSYDNVICVSEAVRKSVCDVIGNPGNLIVKNNPINVNEIVEKSKSKIECLEKYKTFKDKTILVTVGGLREPKGYMRLLECCSKLNQNFNYELWIIGDGPMREKMQTYIKEQDLKNVILWGNQHNPYPFIKSSNCFISSSFVESYGLAVQEALILNVPVLATTCPAFEECVSEGEGMLVENTTEALYKGLYSILNDSKIWHKYKDGISRNRTHENLYTHRLEDIEKLWLERK